MMERFVNDYAIESVLEIINSRINYYEYLIMTDKGDIVMVDIIEELEILKDMISELKIMVDD